MALKESSLEQHKDSVESKFLVMYIYQGDCGSERTWKQETLNTLGTYMVT